MQAANYPGRDPAKPATRRKQWLIGLAAMAIGLLAYAYALAWVSERLETDIQKSLRMAPVSTDDQPR